MSIGWYLNRFILGLKEDRMKKIMIGNIMKCPINDNLYQRTIIVNGVPFTVYSKIKEELMID